MSYEGIRITDELDRAVQRAVRIAGEGKPGRRVRLPSPRRTLRFSSFLKLPAGGRRLEMEYVGIYRVNEATAPPEGDYRQRKQG